MNRHYSEEIIKDLHQKRLIYLLDTFDNVLKELVDEFMAVDEHMVASLYAGMRLNMYVQGSKLGVKDKDRTVKIETMTKDMLHQQEISTGKAKEGILYGSNG